MTMSRLTHIDSFKYELGLNHMENLILPNPKVQNINCIFMFI